MLQRLEKAVLLKIKSLNVGHVARGSFFRIVEAAELFNILTTFGMVGLENLAPASAMYQLCDRGEALAASASFPSP